MKRTAYLAIAWVCSSIGQFGCMMAAPSPRMNHTAVWTGKAMIVWGGRDNTNAFNDGGSYDPLASTWRMLSTNDAPSARIGHTAVWAEHEMIVWGGNRGTNYFHDGGRYDPNLNKWSSLETNGAPQPRSGQLAVWTGNEVIIWGGYGDRYLNTGSRYNPASNRWFSISTNGAPSPRSLCSAVWTGKEMIIWGGWNGTNFFRDGARYSPEQDSWAALSTNDAPSARYAHTTAFLTSVSQMVVWGGNGQFGTFGFMRDGGKYLPNGLGWSVLEEGAPSSRSYPITVNSEHEVFIWGGRGPRGALLRDGGIYNAVGQAWTAISTNDAPMSRTDCSGVWTGKEIIIWGGFKQTYLNDGGRYDPMKKRWTLTPGD